MAHLIQQGCYLAAMVGLMVEHLGDEGPERQRVVFSVDHAGKGRCAGEPFLGQFLGPGTDATVQKRAFLVEHFESFEEVISKTRHIGLVAGEACEEHQVEHHDVVERAVDRAKKRTPVAPPLFVRHAGAQAIEALVHPGVVVCHQAGVVAVDHDAWPAASSFFSVCLSIFPIGRRGSSARISKVLGTL